MSAVEKRKILALVADSGLPRRKALEHLGLSRSTYYRWLKRQSEGRLQDKKGGSPVPWNKLKPGEATKIIASARASPELSCRQLAWQLVDEERWYVSESTVFRILKREGLIKPAEIVGFKAGKEYRRKTSRINELWGTDCCHLRVAYWGWYYLESVMDDFSRFILGWDLKTDKRPYGTTIGQRCRLSIPTIQPIPAPGGDQTHYCLSLPSPDQRQD